MSNELINTKTDVTSGTYSISSGSTYSVPTDRAFNVSGNGTLLKTEDGATGILFASCQGKESSGAISVADGAKAELSNITFSSNTVHKTDSKPEPDSGAMGVYHGASATLTNCFFNNNYSEGYSGVMDVVRSNVTFTGVTFSHNTAELEAGALSLDGKLGATGGTATSVTFDGNTSSAHGGAISLTGQATLYSTASKISNNHAKTYAGGVGVDVSSFAKMSDVAFTSNSAGDMGGAIGNIGITTIESMTLSNNFAGQAGGAVGNGGTFTATAVTFSTNSAGYYGGAIYNAAIEYPKGSKTFYNGTATVTDSLFKGNTAGQAGGAVYNTNVFAVTGSTFTGNKAPNGGAIWNSGTTTVTGSTFSGNTATYNGGAVYSDEKASSFIANSVTFIGNSAGYNGGAVAAYSSATITGCVVSDNQATGNAGAILLHDSVVTDSVFTGNTSKESCGALLFADGSFTLSSSVFSDNSAEVSGGGVSIVNPDSDKKTEGIITGSTFSRNTAKSDNGGAILSALGVRKVTVSDCVVEGNNANRLGGGLAQTGNGVELLLSGSTFSGNIAGQAGGAVYDNGKGKEVTITGCVFKSNTAGIAGGAITTSQKVQEGAKVTVTDCVFNGNIAKQDGGAISNNFDGMMVENCTFETSSDSIYNKQSLIFCGTNTLNAKLYGTDTGLSYSGEDNVVLKGTGTISQKYIAQGNTTTFDGLKLDAQILGGKQNGNVTTAELDFNNVTMTSNAKIYGAGETSGTAVTVGNVDMSFTGSLDSYNGQILAGGKASGSSAKIEASTVSLDVNVNGKVGVIYAGAELSNGGKFIATDMDTTIGGGTFYSYVGNGCRSSNTVDGTMEAEISNTANLTISGGTFKNIVYAGAFTSGNSVKVGGTNLTITGGTFEQMVFGGNGAKSIAASTDATSTVDGNVSVLVDSSTNSISFAKSLVGGSVGEGKITNDVTVTFKGLGSNLSFGETAYVGGDSQKAERYTGLEKSYVSGDRFLVFNTFSGNFSGNIRNGFDTVAFQASEVAFQGQKEVDLRFIDTWNFDVSDGKTDLTWTDGENNFAGDTVNLTGWNGQTQTFMVGSDATLKGWEKATYNVTGVEAAFHIGLADDRKSLQIIAGAA